MIVDSAIYVAGERRAAPESLLETFEACRSMHGVAWIDLVQPDESVFAAVAAEFGLHELSVQDAVHAHQRPKVEPYGQTLFVVLKAAQYVDSAELDDLDELHVFVGDQFVITVRHGVGPDLVRVHRQLEERAELLRPGPQATLYGILDEVVDEYGPVVAVLSNDIDEIETDVFTGSSDVARRTFGLSREVIEFQRAVAPVSRMVASLMEGGPKYGLDAELIRYLRDVQDHAIRVQDQIASFRELLQNIVTVNLNIVGQRQNDEIRAPSEATFRQSEEVKKISAWAAILFAPTLIGTIYGMNFENMPELGWRFGYPLALALMILTGVILFLVFRARGWLSSSG